MKSIASILVCGVLGSLVSLSAQALPLVSAPTNVAGSDVTLVAGGCGLGFHRGPYGGCIRNGYYPPGYVPPPPPGYVPPPGYLPPQPPPVVLGPGRCPYGYALDAYAAVIRSDKPRRRIPKGWSRRPPFNLSAATYRARIARMATVVYLARCDKSEIRPARLGSFGLKAANSFA